MNSIAHELAGYLVGRLSKMQGSDRLIAGLAGIPASGKSTLAEMIVDECNRMLDSSSESSYDVATRHSAILVGLDGWHLTRAQLDAFPDAKLAHDRRGAHWTFDGEAYVNFVRELRKPIDSANDPITAPSFDHALKDPTPHAVEILANHRIVVIEGLYAFLSIDPWKHAGELLDERWFIDVGVEEASERLVKRHVLTGVARDIGEARWRAEENDMPNGRFILQNMLEPTRRIESVEDSSLGLTAEDARNCDD